MPVLCFAAIGFAGPGLSARFRDSHVLSGALVTMAAGLVVRAVAPAFWLFLLGTVLAMVGGALGNVLLPSLVKRYFPDRTGLMVGAYSTAMSVGATVAAVSTAPIAAAAGADGWRWALGVWAVFGAAGRGPVAVRPGERRRLPRHARRRPAARPPAQPDGAGPDGLLRRPGPGGLHRHRLVGLVPARHRPVRRGRGAAAGPEPGDRHPAERPRAGAHGPAAAAAAAAARVHDLLRGRVGRALGRARAPPRGCG